MSRVCLPGLPGLLGLALLAGGACFAAVQPTTKNADAPKKAETTQKSDTEKKTDAAKHTANKPVAPEGVNPAVHKGFRTHLPAHFGRIGLTQEQHQQLKAVMDKYSGQIKQLESQLSEVKSKRDAELHALLSEVQKKALEDARNLATKMRQEGKAASQRAMAAGAERVHEVREQFKAREKLVLEGLAKRKEAQEKAKDAKKADSKEKSNPTEKQPEKK
jgi:hypothetical protein